MNNISLRQKRLLLALPGVGIVLVAALLIMVVYRKDNAPLPSSAPIPDGSQTAIARDAAAATASALSSKSPGDVNLATPVSTQPGALAWTARAIDMIPNVGLFSALIALPDGTKYAAYLDDTRDDLKIARWNGADWSILADADSSKAGSGGFPALAVDGQGALHLSYFGYEEQQVVYARLSPDGVWQREVVAEEVSALDTSLVVSADGSPAIAFLDERTSQVLYAERGGEGWVSTPVSAADPEGGTVPAGLDPQGNPHLVIQTRDQGLVFLSRVDATWQTETVDAQVQTGSYPALVFDTSGRAQVSYYDPGEKDLRYAVREDGAWQSMVVDPDGAVGLYSSIAVDEHQMVHISYYDQGNSALKYAFGNAAGWKLQIVNNDGNVGLYPSLALEQNNPRISYYDKSLRGLMIASANVYPTGAEETGGLSAQHSSGQTFLVWPERADLRGEAYRIYRSDRPIDAENLAHAAFLAQVPEGSSKFWANYRVEDGVGYPRVSEFLIPSDGAAPAGKGTGVFVWTVSAEDFGGNSAGPGYYAVTLLEPGSGAETLPAGFQTGPVEESVADPRPVEITSTAQRWFTPGEGGHYYIQYMDFRNWNPTFHAPNATNHYYGLKPDDPVIPTALAYAYDYTVFEPTAELCGGTIPASLPILVFLHGARENRYGSPDRYPYPFCAYGVYPVDESETWYFGFARQHDYRADAPFSAGDVIENYTEARVLRMIYDLIRQPPGPAVDTQRVYLFGHSMGGTGALAFAQRYPNVFAAIYAGQPVTYFYATEGYREPWPANVAAKWGPQEMNLPIQISAPNGWADPLQAYNGVGVFTWENLRDALGPDDPLHRSLASMVPFGVDHGTTDEAVLYPTHGQPLYPQLNQSRQTWAGAVDTTAHQWSVFAYALQNLSQVDGVPFWSFGVVRDETTPGFSSTSTNLPGSPPGPTTYNQSLLWSASWNPWDGPPVDLPDRWQMSFCSAPPGTQQCGGDEEIQVDITPRRLQKFVVVPGKSYQWETRRVGDNGVIAQGIVTAGADGLITISQVTVSPQGTRLSLQPVEE